MLFLLQGCSAIKIAYNTAPEFGHWWVDGYVDLNDTQSQRVREELAQFQQWHRRSEMPTYAATLQRLEQIAPGDVTPEQVCAIVGELRGKLDRMLRRAETPLTALAMSLDAEQVRHLERKYAKNNIAFRKEWLQRSAAQQQERRFERILDRSEMIYGSLDQEQKSVIRKQLELSAFDPSSSHLEQLRRQKDSLNTLAQLMKPDLTPTAGRELMRAYIERSIDSPDAAYRAYQQRQLRDNCRAFATAHNSTTAAQRETAVRRLRAYRRDVLELARQ
ncbi:MAG: DUF6279 family lipoprotein [Burkholderiaceae bacterium]|nr:DUF6279 family lipoprotein [Burkholderiaceae bacterium]MDP1969101.1 DUF6279 family lipoprotein [Burkholderiaceae bacterium]